MIDTTADPVALARQAYAEELRFTAHVRRLDVAAAFATVPRERFVGPGPWRIRSPMDRARYWTTDNADLRHLYHDVLIALDEARELNNGQPSLWASLLDELDLSPGQHVLHLGCGTGGRVPRWLGERMTRLGAVITEAIVLEYGRDELLRRLAHPVERQYTRPDLLYGFEVWRGAKVLSVLWADDGTFEVASFIRGSWEDEALALAQ